MSSSSAYRRVWSINTHTLMHAITQPSMDAHTVPVSSLQDMHPPHFECFWQALINAVCNALLSVMKRLASVTVAASFWRFIAGRGLMVSSCIFTVRGFTSWHSQGDKEDECRRNNLAKQVFFCCFFLSGKLLKGPSRVVTERSLLDLLCCPAV